MSQPKPRLCACGCLTVLTRNVYASGKLEKLAAFKIRRYVNRAHFGLTLRNDRDRLVKPKPKPKSEVRSEYTTVCKPKPPEDAPFTTKRFEVGAPIYPTGTRFCPDHPHERLTSYGCSLCTLLAKTRTRNVKLQGDTPVGGAA